MVAFFAIVFANIMTETITYFVSGTLGVAELTRCSVVEQALILFIRQPANLPRRPHRIEHAGHDLRRAGARRFVDRLGLE